MSDFEDTAAPFREIILRKDTLIRNLESQLTTYKAEVEKCEDCGDNLTWNYAHDTNGVVQGRLNTHDIKTIFFQSCEYCGSTIKPVSIDIFLEALNKGDT